MIRHDSRVSKLVTCFFRTLHTINVIKIATIFGPFLRDSNRLICCESHGLLYSHDVKLKDEQFCAVESVLRGKDVLAVLPTGFGKSLMYQILPNVFDYMMNVKPLL